MILKTGFGYFVKEGRKISKFELPIGYHPDPQDLTVVEVNSKKELDAIVLDKTDDQINFEKKETVRQSLISSAKQKLTSIAGLTPEEFGALFGA